MKLFNAFQSSDTSTMTVQVENLSPYTTYQLRLIAENDVGRSDPSSPTRDFMTLKAVPEIAPRDVTVTSVSATAFRISWLVSPAIECSPFCLSSCCCCVHMSQDMRFLTMWFVQPAKPQISIRIRAV